MEHLYIVSYDIRCPKRWRQVFKTMHGYGEWVQLSVFQCRLDGIGLLRLEDDLGQAIDTGEDHVLIVDLGPAHNVTPRIKSLGKVFEPVDREAVIV